MAVARKEEIKRDVRALIQHITGLQPGDENFKLCVDFAESNIKYHRFLSPDSHKIEKAIDGLCHKFSVHSQLSKARNLRELADQFLDYPGFEGRDHGKTNTHYALLSLLIESSENPTASTFERAPEIEKKEEVDDFDWRGYLLDAEDLNFINYGSSESEGEELSESSDDGKERHVAWKDDDVRRPDEDESFEEQDPDGRHPLSSDTTFTSAVQPMKGSTASNDYQLLEESLVVEYWKGRGKEDEENGRHVTSNLAKDWNSYLQRMNEFHTPTATIFVTEAQVIRETLWMLSGIKSLFIFTHQDGQFNVNPEIYIAHLTPESLSSYLQPLMTRGGQVCTLEAFVQNTIGHDSVKRQDVVNDEVPVDPTPRTYQAFAYQLLLFLTDFKQAVMKEERKMIDQEEYVSLAKVSSCLRPWFMKLEFVHSIYVRSVKAADSLPRINNALRSSLLLNVLYQILHETDPVDSVHSGSRSELVLNFLIHSSRPLLDIVSSWITNGQFYDPMKEFVVERNKGITSMTETFWDNAFVSHIEYSPETSFVLQGYAGGISSPAKNEKLKPSQTASHDESTRVAVSTTTNKKSTTATMDSKDMDHLMDVTPVFLQPLLKDALIIGKSMELLENLGRLEDVVTEQQCKSQRPPSLFDMMLQDLNTAFPRTGEGEESCSRNESNSKIENEVTHQLQTTQIKDIVVQNHLNARGVKDSLLNIHFSSIFPSNSPTTPIQKSREDKENKDKLKLSAFTVSEVLRHCENRLQSHVKSWYNIVCPKLVDILKSKYQLMECIRAMQRFYLMSDGDIMSDFCYPVFHRIDNREYWQDAYILDMYLHEALSYRFPEEADRLRVEIVPLNQSQARGPINVTDCIRLKYLVPWPVDVVISGKCEELYNSIFSFLLQIKRSKCSLEQLRFVELSKDQNASTSSSTMSQRSHLLGVPVLEDEMERETRIQRFELLRFKLLYFVNSLHNYITTRILHSSGLEFAERFESATDLDQIISIHASYVNIIYERCLLHTPLAALKDTVVQILNLSLTCSNHWHQGVDFIRGTFIEEMESKLTRCVEFISTFLTNVIKRGSFPHLESLAVSLSSLHKQTYR